MEKVMEFDRNINRPTATVEDYLGAIYILARDGETVIGARLADLLQVSPPTVNVTLKRMARDGYVLFNDKKEIILTLHGAEAASDLVRRHMLTEWLLARMLHIPWAELHTEADRIEHTISSDVEKQMCIQFKDAQVCPHGNPLPGYEQVSARWTPLVDTMPGWRVIIRRIHEHAEDNSELLRFLETNHILPGSEVDIQEKLLFNQTLTILCEGQTLTLGTAVAKSIFVEKIPFKTDETRFNQ